MAFALLIEQNCTNTGCEGRIPISKGRIDEKYKTTYWISNWSPL